MALTPQVNFGNMLMTQGGAIAGECCCGDETSSCPNPNDPEMLCTVTAVDAKLPITWLGVTWEKSFAGGGPADPLSETQRRSGASAIICPDSYGKGYGRANIPPSITPTSCSTSSEIYFGANHAWRKTTVNGRLDMDRTIDGQWAINWGPPCPPTKQTQYTVGFTKYILYANNRLNFKGKVLTSVFNNNDDLRFGNWATAPYPGPTAPYFTNYLYNGLNIIAKLSYLSPTSANGKFNPANSVGPPKMYQGSAPAKPIGTGPVAYALNAQFFDQSVTVDSAVFSWSQGNGW